VLQEFLGGHGFRIESRLPLRIGEAGRAGE
jgi:hypothetical protein